MRAAIFVDQNHALVAHHKASVAPLSLCAFQMLLNLDQALKLAEQYDNKIQKGIALPSSEVQSIVLTVACIIA